MSSPENYTPEEARGSVRDRRRAGIVDVESKIEEVARHRADERLNRELRGDFGEREAAWRRQVMNEKYGRDRLPPQSPSAPFEKK